MGEEKANSRIGKAEAVEEETEVGEFFFVWRREDDDVRAIEAMAALAVQSSSRDNRIATRGWHRRPMSLGSTKNVDEEAEEEEEEEDPATDATFPDFERDILFL